jgi:hypothetical protein
MYVSMEISVLTSLQDHFDFLELDGSLAHLSPSGTEMHNIDWSFLDSPLWFVSLFIGFF